MLNPGVSSTNTNINRSRTTPERKVGSMSNYMNRTPARSLTAGQVIRGEITDLRNNEITLTLEDNTQVTGHLTEGAKLSIGETAAFLITNIQPDKISLELVKHSLRSSEQTTINKALEEAGLPKNEKNQSIVSELLKNHMPIHKQSIMNVLTQSYQFKDISIPTIVVMNRLGMEITSETAARFEDCRTHTNTLSSEAAELSQAVTDCFRDASAEDTQLLRELLALTNVTELSEEDGTVEMENLSIPSYEQPVQPAFPTGLSGIFKFQRLSGLLSPQGGTAVKQEETVASSSDSGMISSSDKEELTNSISAFTESQKSILSELAKPEKPMNPMAFYQKPVNISEELQSLIDNLDAFSKKSSDVLSSEELPLRDAISLLQEGQHLADDIDFFQIEQTRNHFLDKHPNFSSLLEEQSDSPEFEQLSLRLEQLLEKVPSSASLFSPELSERLEQQYNTYLQEKGTIASVLTSQELEELVSETEKFPFDQQLKDRLTDGDVTPKEFLTALRSNAELVDDTSLASLFKTAAFPKLFEQDFLSSFFLTPKQIAKSGGAEEFFDKTYEKLHEISDILSKQQNSSESSDTFDFAHQKSDNMQKHFDFLKSFNELFTYVQIPATLKNGTLSGDLYVYTNKERMREQPKQLSVLLHLGMEHLGPLDIYLSLNNATVTSQIYCENGEIKRFLSSQIPSLKTALSLKGYLFEADVREREKSFDFVQDFIQKKEVSDTAKDTSQIKRYTFDIRA